jgi:glycosyltransferase involved in cell wall biosynthesis
MESKFTYSVIITTVNRPRMLQECLESLRVQTKKIDQVIIVDDSIVGQDIAIHPELSTCTVILRTSGIGRSLARNAGLAVVSTDFISFLDDDDMWTQDRLSKVDMYMAENLSCRAVHHNVYFFAQADKAQNPYGGAVDFIADDYLGCESSRRSYGSRNDFSHLDIAGDSFRSLLIDNRGCLPGSVICRRLAQSVGGFCPFLSSAEDQLFFLMIATSTEWHHLDEYLVYVRLHDQQGSSSPDTLTAIITGLVLILWGGGIVRFLRVRVDSDLISRYWQKFRFLLKLTLKDKNIPMLQRFGNLLLLLVLAVGILRLQKI